MGGHKEEGGREDGWIHLPVLRHAQPCTGALWSGSSIVSSVLKSQRKSPQTDALAPFTFYLNLQPRAPAAPVAGLGAAGGRPAQGGERERGTGKRGQMNI
ncbi:unnamed protein product [Pleuronectes platessa]|uniref:Uncharacterized protein n=1 Tax=Pleuronectes platessa TaxID=8262 RepID=A0A9N7VWL9_PLEPL|nr:unnamed protein product [Pleuronectes platessa]